MHFCLSHMPRAMPCSCAFTPLPLSSGSHTFASLPGADSSHGFSNPPSLRDLLSVARIPAHAKVFSDSRAAPHPVFLCSPQPAPRIPAHLHDGNLRTGTVPPTHQYPQMSEQHHLLRPTVASHASPACQSI